MPPKDLLYRQNQQRRGKNPLSKVHHKHSLQFLQKASKLLQTQKQTLLLTLLNQPQLIKLKPYNSKLNLLCQNSQLKIYHHRNQLKINSLQMMSFYLKKQQSSKSNSLVKLTKSLNDKISWIQWPRSKHFKLRRHREES